jgi:hypothetical protein
MPNSLMRILRALFKIRRTEREMERELRFHLEMEAELPALRNGRREPGGVSRDRRRLSRQPSG